MNKKILSLVFYLFSCVAISQNNKAVCLIFDNFKGLTFKKSSEKNIVELFGKDTICSYKTNTSENSQYFYYKIINYPKLNTTFYLYAESEFQMPALSQIIIKQNPVVKLNGKEISSYNRESLKQVLSKKMKIKNVAEKKHSIEIDNHTFLFSIENVLYEVYIYLSKENVVLN